MSNEILTLIEGKHNKRDKLKHLYTQNKLKLYFTISINTDLITVYDPLKANNVGSNNISFQSLQYSNI